VASHKTVTTHRASKKTITASRTAVTLATATVGSIALVPGLAHADPSETVKDVQNKIKDLQEQAEVIAEQYNASNAQLADLQHKVDQIQGRIATEQAALGDAQSSLGTLAAAQYKSGGLDSSLQLMLKNSPDAYLQQASVLNEISNRSADSVKSAQEARRQLDQDRATATSEMTQMQKTRDQIAAQKAQIEAKQKAAKQLLDSLTPTQRVQYNQTVKQGSSSAIAAPTGLPPAPNARAAIAVAFAKAQVGKPYVYGAAGPSAFDCTGLTMVAWGKAGVQMAHSSSDQFYAFPKIKESDLQPGDLVVYYGNLHHVGMYVGNGTIVHAANSSSPIEYSPLHSMPVAGYVRP
jgi:cell wall-associated NlpC family hydrolase